ncbi:amino acid adenylation domain-containing protein [Streptomyces sp. NBC_00280]|uniref:amino acid adenylation domain-containing protein n=1 Tax=Streptomyces sp. NBC_00280 TaxID=2975699 RepID=UPI003245A1C4
MKKDRSELLRQRVALRGRPRAPQPLPATGIARPDSVPNRAGHLVEAFAAVVAEFPDRVAVQDGERSWTYRQLDETAGQLAVALGAVTSEPGRTVGILLERSAWMVAAALAVLRTGSSYVPLDPETPPARLELIVEDAEPAALITSRVFAGQVPDGVPAVFVDDPLPEAGTEAPEPTIDRDTRAYIIFTSGTTGRPKGVQVSHGNLLSLLAASEEVYDFGPEDVWPLFHSFAFDFSVWEMWGALLYGCRLVVVPAQTAKEPAAFRRLLREERITVLCQTPTAFHQLAAEDTRFADRLPLRWVIFGGETLYFSDLEPWFAKYGDDSPRLLNGYGITETTVLSSFHRVTKDQLGSSESLIGRPVAGTGFLLLDDSLSAVPQGEVGEIVVTGPGISLGYLKSPDLNRDRFVELPDGHGRGYRSGDLARLTPTGAFAYHGRKDDQVKIRGFRIELGEIEQALRALPSLTEAAVVARDLPGRGKSLVAYVVPTGAESLSVEPLYEALAATLPGYMIPRVFVRLDRLPLTQNGKADRKALPEPTADSTLTLQETGLVQEPADAVEDRVLRIVTDLLHLDRVDPTADFFDLGGHSLLATRLLAGVRVAFDVEVSLREFLGEPTPRALAAVVREHLAQPSRGRSRAVVIVKAPEATHQPVTDAQRRLYFLSQLAPDNPAYHLHTTLLLEGGLDVEALERAFTAVVERHAPLRTVLRVEDGELVQVTQPAAPFRLLPEELPQFPGEEWRQTVDRLAERESVRPFDLSCDPMLRVRLVRVAPALHVLLVTAHHIATDGWSIAVLSRELKTLYAHFRKNPEDGRIPLAPLPYTYVDYAYSMQQWLGGPDWEQDLAYWEEHLAALPTVHRLPLDSPRPTRTYAGDTVTTRLTGPVADAVRRACREESVTLFTLLQTAFSLLLARHSGSDDIVVGSPVANRPTAELDDVIGMFVNTLVLRTRLDGAATFRELLARVREQTTRDLEHQHVPLALLLKRLNPPHSPDHAPLFQIMLVLQNNETAVLDLDGLDITPVRSPDPGAQAELMLDTVEEAGDLTFRWRYNTGLFRRDTVAGLADEFGRLLTHLSGGAEARTAPLEQAGRPAASIPAFRAPKTSSGDHTALLRLRQHAAGAPPVFALPGVLGLGESFAQLSSHFRDRSFYALSTADLVRAHDSEPMTAAALAGECARIIAATVDGGALHIVGHSYGGSLGFHVAEQLRERDIPVAGLVLLDALDPAALAKELSGGYDDQLLAFLTTLGGLFPGLARHRDTDLRELLRTESTASVLKRVENIIGPPAVEFFQGGLETAFQTYRRTCNLSWPEPRAADHPALFVRANGADGRASAQRPSGWTRHLPDSLRVEGIDADHEGMLRNPHAGRLAELLQPFLTAHDAPHDTEKSGTKSVPGKGATAR